jgi:hypothetical protein
VTLPLPPEQTPEDARTVALLAAIFLATDDVCRYLSQLESAVEKNYSGGDWNTTTEPEAIERARDLLAMAGVSERRHDS